MMLDDNARARLTALADVLIPGSGDFPSASAAGVPTALIDQALGYRPDLSDDLDQALALARGLEPTDALDQLATAHPGLFETLTTLVSGAWLLSPQVQKALNYRPAPRAATDDVNSYLDLLEPVFERGFDIHGADLT